MDSWQQWLAVLFNVLYVVYAVKRRRICWIFGAIGVTLLFVIYVQARLFSDASLQVFYLIMSAYGYVTWRRNSNEQPIAVRRDRLAHHLLYLVLGGVLTLLLGRFWTLFDAALPYIDAATTAFSLIATYLVAQRYLENWIYWIAIDAVCVWVYLERDLPLLAVLFALYTLLAIWGFLQWRNLLRAQVI